MVAEEYLPPTAAPGTWAVRFLALCSSSVRKTMSAKATATAAWDWKDPEAADQAPGPHPRSAPTHVPPSPPHDPHMLPPRGFKKPWKGKVGREPKIELPEEAYKKDAETPTEYWWAHPDGMWLQTFRFGCAFHVIFMQNACFPMHLPILCVAEEDEIAFDGPQPWHINWYDGLDEQQHHQLQHQAQRKEEGEEAQEGMKTDEAEDPWNLAWREEPQPDDPYAQWQKEIEIEHLADIVGTPSPSPTPPGTPKHSPQPRTEAAHGMHRYAPLHHGTCYMVPFLHRQPLFTATMEQRKKDWEERRPSPEPQAEGAPKTRAVGAPPSERGIPHVPSNPMHDPNDPRAKGKMHGGSAPAVMGPRAGPYSIHSKGGRCAVRAPMCPLTPCKIPTTQVPRGRRTVGARPLSLAPMRGHIQSIPEHTHLKTACPASHFVPPPRSTQICMLCPLEKIGSPRISTFHMCSKTTMETWRCARAMRRTNLVKVSWPRTPFRFLATFLAMCQ